MSLVLQEFIPSPPTDERVMGTEHELALQEPPVRQPDAEARIQSHRQALANLLSKETLRAAGYQSYSSQNKQFWLDNGASIGVDSELVEWRSAETFGAKNATAAYEAGRISMGEIVEATGQELWLFRRSGSTDLAGNIYPNGFHYSMSMPRGQLVHQGPEIEAVLAADLASRMWSWSGMATPNGYLLSQKAASVVHGVTSEFFMSDKLRYLSMAHIQARPGGVIPNNEGETGARLEVRCGDVSSEWDLYTNLAATSLTLRALEHHILQAKDMRWLRLADPVAAMQTFSRDLSLCATVETQTGEQVSALDLRDILSEAYANLRDHVGVAPSEARAIPEIAQVERDAHTVAQTGDSSILADRVGWAARLSHLRAEGVWPAGTRPAKAIKACMLWDRSVPEGVGRKYWRAHGRRMVSDKTIAALVHEPPQDTRALVRSRAIRDPGIAVRAMSWSYLQALRRTGKHTAMHRGNLAAGQTTLPPEDIRYPETQRFVRRVLANTQQERSA